MKVFVSYDRAKDQFHAVSQFREHFANELNQLVPDSIVLQDTEYIGPGDHYPGRLANELAAADLLLIILSPAWLSRPWCRWEYRLFCNAERVRGRTPRVLPVLWVQTDELKRSATDAIARELAVIDFADWREVRHQEWTNPTLRKATAQLAARAKMLANDSPPLSVATADVFPPASDTPARARTAIGALLDATLGDWNVWLDGDKPFCRAGDAYADQLQSTYNSIRVLGMDAPVPLRSVYVRVNVLEKITARHTASVKELETFFERDTRGYGIRRATINALELVNTVQKVIVLGKPGVGKSTFLKFLALCAVDGALAKPRVPIFVSLKEWSESGVPLIQFVAGRFETCEFPDPLPYVRRLLNTGSCILLLDGLDEVTFDVSKAITELTDFSRLYHDNQFVLSCRIASYDYVFEQFSEVEIADFGEQQIRTFVENWFGRDSGKARGCLDELDKHAAIRELAGTPLLLTLLCLAFDEPMSFPTNRAELYRDAVQVLLKKWDSSRNIRRQEVYKELTTSRKQDLLGFVAHSTFQHGQYFMHRTALESYVSTYFRQVSPPLDASVDIDSEMIVKCIEAHHGLWVERAKGIYSFSHLTIQEYFAAFHFVGHWDESSKRDALVGHLLRAEWHEVILLAAAMLPCADDLVLAMRVAIRDAATTSVRKLLDEVQDSVRAHAGQPAPVSRAWALVFILDRLRAVTIAGVGTPRAALEHSREATTFFGYSDHYSDDAAEDVELDLDRALERAAKVACVMDPAFNRKVDFERRDAVRRALDFAAALQHVRARDRARTSYVDLHGYLYGTELLFRCLDGGCRVSPAVRESLHGSLLSEC
jgi:hypothetical protein